MMFIVSESDGLGTVLASRIGFCLCVIAALEIFLDVIVQVVPDVYPNGVRLLEDLFSKFIIVDVTIPAFSSAVHEGLVLVLFPQWWMVREAHFVETASLLSTNIGEAQSIRVADGARVIIIDHLAPILIICHYVAEQDSL